MKKKPGFGRKLLELHRWNAWVVAVLAVSGLLLAWGALRGLGAGRIWIQQLHLAIGIASGILIVLYAPLAGRHLKQLKQRPRQKGNLGFVMVLLIGWLVSGILLWQLRHLPPHWGNNARLAHQLLTYIGLPYICYHSIARIRWMKQPGRRAVKTTEPEVAGASEIAPSPTPAPSPIASSAETPVSAAPAPTSASSSAPSSALPRLSWGDDGDAARADRSARRAGPPAPGPWMNRRQFLKASLGIALAAIALPPFLRWFKSVPGASAIVPLGDQMAADNPNAMLPDPQPLPDSLIPIGGGANGRFQAYTVTRMPVFSSDTWRFTMDGLVERPAVWDWEQFLGLARTVQVSDFHCVTGWSVYKNTWEGIPLSRLLEDAGVKPQAVSVKCYSGDGVYTDALTLEQAKMDDVMVAILHDGKPIHRDFGGPARLIVPQMYAYKSVKWLNRIELIDREHIGYWEERGYDKDAWLKGKGVPL